MTPSREAVTAVLWLTSALSAEDSADGATVLSFDLLYLVSQALVIDPSLLEKKGNCNTFQ